MRRWAHLIVPYALLIAIGGGIALWLWAQVDDLRGRDAVELQRPWALLLLAAVPLVVWVGFHLRARRAPTFLFSRVPDLAVARPGLVARLAALPVVLRVVALALVAVALAQPRTFREVDREVEGIDIMFVLDLSRSMEERDLSHNRLDAAQRTIRRFLHRRRHVDSDRIGLVVFAEDAMLQCPLTLDYDSLEQIVADLAIGDVPEMGTAIGDGLGLALASLRRSDARSKVVILLSDGDSNVVNEMDPIEAKDIAVASKIRVFTILMGLEQGRARGFSRYAVNPKLLRDIAGDTGGRYFNAGDDRELEQSFREVRSTLEKTRRKVTGRVPNADLFPMFLHPALLLLGLEILLAFTRWRRFP